MALTVLFPALVLWMIVREGFHAHLLVLNPKINSKCYIDTVTIILSYIILYSGPRVEIGELS